jgi:hypothetical protein
MALFGGVYFESRRTALALPLLAMLLSDVLLSLVYGWTMGWMTAVIYSCFVLSVWLGIRMRAKPSPQKIVRASFLSALVFFIVTNFAVWGLSSFYPKDLGGLWTCYVAALPFFGNSLAGYGLYGLLLFGGFALLRRRFEVLAQPVASGAS